MHLLDTCILIDILRGRPEALALGEEIGEEIAISVISIQELFAGIRPGERPAIEMLLGSVRALPVTARIAEQSGAYLQSYFRSHGVGSNDSLIAATTSVTGATLVTCNLKHFPMFRDLKRPY